MIRERIADDVYVFRSRRYAQVTAGAVLTKEGAILIDTLYYPEETRQIKEFLEGRLGLKIRYVINTHYHADHTQGTYLFPEARVVSHALCRQLLDTLGREGLTHLKGQSPEFEEVEITLPDLVFDQSCYTLSFGGKTLRLQHYPGHSPDLITVFVANDRVLFASDAVMPVPTLFDGSYTDLVNSLQSIQHMNLDCVVQGHGEVILRGEIEAMLRSDLAYLTKIRKAVEHAITNGNSESALETISIESCGKSRIPLNGFVSDLHFANLHRLYHDLNGNGKGG